MPHNILGQSIALKHRAIKTSPIHLWVSGQINSPTDDLTKDAVLSIEFWS